MQIIGVLFPLLWESEFAHGRSEASPDSEQIEHTVATQHVRNSVSVEQIQDRVRVRANAFSTITERTINVCETTSKVSTV